MELVHEPGSVLLRRAAPIACGAAVVAAASYVALNDPTEAGSRFPACPFYALTGLWCPGCGLTRGVHSLLTGDVAAAVSANAFTPVVVVLVVTAWWAWTRRAFGSTAPSWLSRVRPSWWIAAGAALVVFGVIRNLPVAPLQALAP